MGRRARLSGTGPRAQPSTSPRTLPETSGPVRTCVGCRERDQRSALLRLVLEPSGREGVLVVDVRGCLPGRGAWIHPTPACLALAERRRAVPRALRVTGPLDLSGVREHLERRDR
ncbi:YlxR family protein [Isoptericola sp. NPDC056578]|uniref:YlxR family protein n=1 Tax=Isoptericola sp. NPDC056578 TaxID=3345870 RepID=UPI0036BF138A